MGRDFLDSATDKVNSDMQSSPGALSTPADGTAPDSSAGSSPESSQTTAPDGATDPKGEVLTEIEKLGRFKFGGKEWTAEEAKKAWLLQQDYTKKSQTLSQKEKEWEKQVKEYREKAEGYGKYVQNFEIDIQNVLRDPRLAAEFKKIYPTEFHSILDERLKNQPSNVPQGTSQQPTRDPYLESRLSQLEQQLVQREQVEQQKIFQAEVKANEAFLDSICDRLGKEFKFADQDAVLSRAEQLLSKMSPEQLSAPNFQERWESEMEKLFKTSHDTHFSNYQAYYKEMVDKQKQANQRGKDMGPGGSIPARAPQRLRLKDVENHILNELAANGRV